MFSVCQAQVSMDIILTATSICHPMFFHSVVVRAKETNQSNSCKTSEPDGKILEGNVKTIEFT